MALHEYPQALAQLQQAVELGVQSAEVHYALGLVLGKHYEQTIYEARLSGGGTWATKQLKEIDPKYLQPAIEELKRSRAIKLDAPQYLEGMIAYYQKDYAEALRQAEAAQKEAPWLYEATKLAGDVHLTRALQAKDSGRYEEAQKEFDGAVHRYEEAAAIGRSDGEVYEELAETWVRQLEMATRRGQPADKAYAAAMRASDQVTATEPESIAGPLKKAFTSMLSQSTHGSGGIRIENATQCLVAAQVVLTKQPGHPYASEVASCCNQLIALGLQERGEDPEPPLRKSLSLLEPTVKKYPHFLWGLNDLSTTESALGHLLQRRGDPAAKEMLQHAVEHATQAASLDTTYANAPINLLDFLVSLIVEARSDNEVQSILSQADAWFAKCVAINNHSPSCISNYFQVYGRAAWQALRGGLDPQPRLQRALENLRETRKLGGRFVDVEQYAALTHLVEARDRVRRKQDPTPALGELDADLKTCFALTPQDAMCRTQAAQAQWVRAEWTAQQGQSPLPHLKEALDKAILATQSPEKSPETWQTLAETHLRLARAQKEVAAPSEQQVADGLAAVEKLFAINPRHAMGRATQGALQLERWQQAREPKARAVAAQAAVQALDQALRQDPFLKYDYAPLLAAARALPQ